MKGVRLLAFLPAVLWRVFIFTNAAGQEAPTSISWGGMPDLAVYFNVYCA